MVGLNNINWRNVQTFQHLVTLDIFSYRTIDYADSKKRKKTMSQEPVLLKKSKVEVKLSAPETPSFVR